MTVQEAIDRISKCKVRPKPDNALDLVALLAAKKALEKQIPKKPLPEEKYYGNGKCPSCGAVFIDKSTNYCGNCGQALDWSGVK